MTSTGAARPGMSAVVMTMSCLGDVLRHQRRLFGLILSAHRLGVAGRGFGLLELFIFNRDELTAE